MQKKAINYLWATVMTMVLLVLPVSAGAGKKQMPEEYAAKVNGSVITQEFFERAVNQMEQRFARMGKPLSDSQLSEIKKDLPFILNIVLFAVGAALAYVAGSRKSLAAEAAGV